MLPAYMQTRLEDGICHQKYFMDGKAVEKFFYGVGLFWYFVTYLCPCLIFFILYGKVIYTFHQRKANTELGSSQIIDKATSQLTKTAIIVTLIFILSFGYDINYIMLGYTGFVRYIKNTPLQKIGLCLSSVNSVSNPFVYYATIPAYRESLKKTFCKFILKKK